MSEADAKQIVRGAEKLLHVYGAVIEQYPIGFVDASVLPADKDTMKLALKIAWKVADEDYRKIISGGYVDLYRFQQGVGPNPVLPLPPGANAPAIEDREAMRAIIRATNNYLAWAKKTETEMMALLSEMRALRNKADGSVG